MAAVRTRPELVLVGALLATVGGYLDAYTYIGRGGVFANAQTGNVVLIGVRLAGGHWHAAVSLALPLAAFALGVLVAETLGLDRVRTRVRRPTRVVLGVEIALLTVVGLVPQGSANRGVTTTVAFVAALQLCTFRSLRGVAYNSTMTTGNLRSLVVALHARVVGHDLEAGHQAGPLAVVVGSFVAGACVGALATRAWGAPAAWPPAVALLVVLMSIARETAHLEAQTS